MTVWMNNGPQWILCITLNSPFTPVRPGLLLLLLLLLLLRLGLLHFLLLPPSSSFYLSSPSFLVFICILLRLLLFVSKWYRGIVPRIKLCWKFCYNIATIPITFSLISPSPSIYLTQAIILVFSSLSWNDWCTGLLDFSISGSICWLPTMEDEYVAVFPSCVPTRHSHLPISSLHLMGYYCIFG